MAVAAMGAKQIPIIRRDISSWTFITVQFFLKTSMAIVVIDAVPFIERIRDSRFLLFTGVISYEMYLAHGFIYEKSLYLMGGEQKIWFAICFFPILYVLCYLLYRNDDRLERSLNTLRKKLIR